MPVPPSPLFLLYFGPIGRSENKTTTKFSSYESDVKPGMVMTGMIFSYLQEVNPSILDMVDKFDHPV